MRFLRSTFSTSARVSAWKSAGLPSIHTCTGPAQRLPPRTPHRKAGFEPSLGGAGQASRARGERFARRAWRARCRGRGRGTHLDALSALRQDLAERHNPGRANAAHASADEWVDNSSAQMSCPAAARLLDILQGRAAGWLPPEAVVGPFPAGCRQRAPLRTGPGAGSGASTGPGPTGPCPAGRAANRGKERPRERLSQGLTRSA